ncbi:TolC family protein [Bacteroides sp. 51]|uniref:TolC family protein n=1 Tax=Bacteroides sp. 51 TaxID=2302938 RepID=UPI0013D42F79|nr:TolC family protein [Bacteroides sp. 51]NDV81964.1 TolC family protein [Bacteroides sp. 51]
MTRVKRWIGITLCVGAFFACQSLYAQERPIVWDLATCIDYAMEHNISIQKSRINAESSSIDVRTAKANLFPNLSFNTSHNYVNRPLTEDGSAKKNSYNGNYGLNSSWTVYNGGKNTKTISQEKLNSRMAELDVAQNENDIEVAITQLYVQILYAAESVKINESTVEVSEAQMNRAKELLAVGSIARSDYAQMESQYSSDKYQLVNSLASLQDYKLQLKQLLELDGEEEMELSMPELSDGNVLNPLPTKTDVYRAALTFRPEIEAGKLNIEASDLGIDIARAGYMPTLSLSAGIGTNHTTGSDFTFGEQVKNGWNNSIGLTVSVPIFNNRQTKSAVQKAKLQYQSSKLDMLNEEKALYSTIEGIWLDANTAQQRYVAAKENLNSTQISYDLVNEQFTLGMKNTVELLTEKNNLLSAKQELIQAKYMAILNMQLLRFYQGEEIVL